MGSQPPYFPDCVHWYKGTSAGLSVSPPLERTTASPCSSPSLCSLTSSPIRFGMSPQTTRSTPVALILFPSPFIPSLKSFQWVPSVSQLGSSYPLETGYFHLQPSCQVLSKLSHGQKKTKFLWLHQLLSHLFMRWFFFYPLSIPPRHWRYRRKNHLHIRSITNMSTTLRRDQEKACCRNKLL